MTKNIYIGLLVFVAILASAAAWSDPIDNHDNTTGPFTGREAALARRVERILSSDAELMAGHRAYMRFSKGKGPGR